MIAQLLYELGKSLGIVLAPYFDLSHVAKIEFDIETSWAVGTAWQVASDFPDARCSASQWSSKVNFNPT